VIGIRSTALFCAAFSFATLAHSQGNKELLERGRYLGEGIAACGNCHTARDEKGAPVPERGLSGGMVFEAPVFRAVAPNITPDPETGIGKWTEANIIEVLKSGLTPDGDTVGGAMTDVVNHGTSFLNDADLKAIAVYLKSVKPVRNKVEKKK